MKDTTLLIRLSSKEKAAWKEMAESKKKNLSEWIRETLNRAAKKGGKP